MIGGCGQGPEICSCRCHKEGGRCGAGPCGCRRCEFCGLPIDRSFYNSHVKKCYAKFGAFMAAFLRMGPRSSSRCPHECWCECHKTKGLVHVVACCEGPCLLCIRPIKFGMFGAHFEECHHIPPPENYD